MFAREPQGERLVARMSRSEMRPMSARPWAPRPRRCSRLSSTRSARCLRGPRRAVVEQRAPGDSRTPTTRAIAAGTSAGSEIEARPTRCTGRSTAAAAAASSASLLLPAPPGPAIVTSRTSVAGQQGLRFGEVAAAADEAMVQCGQRRASERRERREALLETRARRAGTEPGSGDVLSLWLPSRRK